MDDKEIIRKLQFDLAAADALNMGHEGRIERLQNELEIERMRLAACGVVAMANTQESAARVRIAKDNPYWSASLSDVEAAVDRQMKLREQLEAEQKSVNELSLQVQELEFSIKCFRANLNSIKNAAVQSGRVAIANMCTLALEKFNGT